MRHICISFIFAISLISMVSAHAMERARQERGLIARIVHRFNQELYPLDFYTDDKAPVVLNDVLKFDPTHPNHETYKGDTKNLADVTSVLSRHRKGLISLWNACKNQDSDVMEELKKAQENTAGYCSQNHIAIIYGFWETRVHATNGYLRKLNQHVAPGILSSPIISEATTSENIQNFAYPDEQNFPSFEKVRNTVLESHPDLKSKFWNLVVKNLIEQVPHLLNKKSQIISMAALHLHPLHPCHTENWKLNLNDLFHLCLIYQAIDREYKLSQIIENALYANDLNVITQLDPNNPGNQQVMRLLASSYPPVIRTLITGYIHKVKLDKEADEKKRREQAELVEKSHAVNTLINSIRRKLSDVGNKEKLKSLTEQQKNIPLIAGNILTAHRGAGLAEVRESHKMLTDFSALVEQLLATSHTPPPSLNNSATSLPSLPLASSPLAQVIDASRLTTTLAPLSSSAPIAQTQLPASATPPVLTPSSSNATLVINPASASPLASVAEATAVVSTFSSSSPQASPPRTPNGSLVVAPAGISLEEEFNPRAAEPAPIQLHAPPAPVPATKQLAESKGKHKRGK